MPDDTTDIWLDLLAQLAGPKSWLASERPAELTAAVLGILDDYGWIEFRYITRGKSGNTTSIWFSPQRQREQAGDLPQILAQAPDRELRVSPKGDAALDKRRLLNSLQAAPEPEGRGAAPDAMREKTGVPPSRLKAAAVYEWALAAIPGADDMTIADLLNAIRENLDTAVAAMPVGPEAEKLSDFRDSLPSNSETFGKYLREAGLKRYNTAGDRIRKISHFTRRDQA